MRKCLARAEGARDENCGVLTCELGPFINSVTRDGGGGKSRSKIERDAGSKYTEYGLKVV